MRILNSFMITLPLFLLPWPLYGQWQQIADGILYDHKKKNDQSIHLLKVDTQKIRLELATGKKSKSVAQKTSSFAQQAKALAAINAGFFDMGTSNNLKLFLMFFLDRFGFYRYSTVPSFTMKKDGLWYATSNQETGAIGWADNGTILFDVIKTQVILTIRNQTWPVDGLNVLPVDQKAILYSSVYDQKTPQQSNITEIIIGSDNQLKKIIKNSTGGTSIVDDSYVYVIPSEIDVDCLRVGMEAHIEISVLSEEKAMQATWQKMETILGSTPLLIKDSKILDRLYEEKSSFYTRQHPRTAVAHHKDGSLLLVTIDGRKSDTKGFTMLELAEFLLNLNAVDALNLDGGGSTTMIIADELINTPSGHSFDIGSYERSVANALLLLPKIEFNKK